MTDAPQEASRSNLAQRLIAALGQCDRVLVERKNAVGEYDVEIFQADIARAAADLVPRWSSDMDAAPKDGMRLLLFVPGYGAMTGHFDERWHLHSCINKKARPSHWMPLPAPPKEGE